MPLRRKLHIIPLPKINTNINTNTKILITSLSFLIPITTLYILDPNTFQIAWKGRAPYVFFLWLFFLELILSRKKLPEEQSRGLKWFRTTLTIIFLSAPFVYVVSIFFFGLRHNIVELGRFIGLPFMTLPTTDKEWFVQFSWPLSLELMILAVFFAMSVLLMYKSAGLRRFSVSLFFLGATGAVYMIDTFYPYGAFTILQAFAPVSATAAVAVLNLMGYGASWNFGRLYGELMPFLRVRGLNDTPAISWSCAGIHSLFIYTFTILLFLKDAPMSTQRKIIYIVIGAVGTFIINVLRIVSYCVIAVNSGRVSADVFHGYYGELYFIAWIIVYPSAILYGPLALEKLRKLKLTRFLGKTQPSPDPCT